MGQDVWKEKLRTGGALGGCFCHPAPAFPPCSLPLVPLLEGSLSRERLEQPLVGPISGLGEMSGAPLCLLAEPCSIKGLAGC